jgi:glycine/D-amino acid oxidase-like deaminating enzyme
LVPFGNRRFWCGATFEWNYANEETTAAQQQVLMHHLTDMLAVPFTVEKQLAAVRPTNKERRPFLLSSPLNPAVWMLNGLGTKGALLAPWYAEQLANRILNTE